jgi:hypothetical protein
MRNDLESTQTPAAEPVPDTQHDWISHLEKYSPLELEEMVNWLEITKKLPLYEYYQLFPIVTPEKLNREQLFAYSLTDKYLIDQKQLLMIMTGKGGTGKSFTIFSISELINKAARNLTNNELAVGVKRCAPTAKAAYLVIGDTVHYTFNIPVVKTTTKIMPLVGEQLQILQDSFKGSNQINIIQYNEFFFNFLI